MTWPLVVGLGSHHGDDQAGWLVLDDLQKKRFPCERLIRLRHPADLLDHVEAERSLVICDACAGGGLPGTTRLFQWPSENLIYSRPAGSHDLSLCEVLQLGRQLDCLPDAVRIWVVEGAAWSAGSEPSNSTRVAAASVADAIWEGCSHA
jgi:hydrogenase maturation protease